MCDLSTIYSHSINDLDEWSLELKFCQVNVRVMLTVVFSNLALNVCLIGFVQWFDLNEVLVIDWVVHVVFGGSLNLFRNSKWIETLNIEWKRRIMTKKKMNVNAIE